MSLLDSLGIQGMNVLLGQSQAQYGGQMGQSQAQYGGQMGQSLMQQQYNQAFGARQETKWKFNGIDLNVRDMANAIWPTDCPEKTHFLLKYE